MRTDSITSPDGSLLEIADAYGVNNGFRFAEWTVDSVRQADLLGRALGGFKFDILIDTSVLANFVDETADTDGDSIPDWFELHFYGNLDQLSASDTDGDGFDLDLEFRRDYHPNLFDEILDGGISVRLSAWVCLSSWVLMTTNDDIFAGFQAMNCENSMDYPNFGDIK